jgi:predicted Holliday junction resolvase-like endonuclease
MTDFEAFLRDGRHIFSMCPQCGALHRLSDIPLSYQGETPFVDWKDRIDTERDSLETERRTLVAKEKTLKDEYREKAQGEAMRPLLGKVAPSFVRADIDPRDVRTIIEPTEFVEFRGYTKNSIESVRFLQVGPSTPLLESIRRTLAAKEVGWLTLQVSEDGIIVPKPPPAKRRSRAPPR